jgi:phosphoserine phosphatase
VTGLTGPAAERACAQLKRRGMDCLVVRGAPTQVADTGDSAG